MKEKPLLPPNTHPIHTKRYKVSTNPINEMAEKVYYWMESGVPGGIIYGRPRLGKTSAAQYIMKIIPELFNEKIPATIGSCPYNSSGRESAFYSFLLNTLKHPVPNRGYAEDKRIRIIKYISCLVNESGQNKFLLVLDEAQNLAEYQFDCLMNIYNELNYSGIQLHTVLVGQNELKARKTALLQSGYTQIVGRFMLDEYQFRGIKNENDFSVILKSYDEDSIYPIDSDCTFTEYFFFEQYQQGFRLNNFVEELFTAFRDIKSEENININSDIPMFYLIPSIEYVLKKFGNEGLSLDQLSVSHWKEGISSSLYTKGEQIDWQEKYV